MELDTLNNKTTKAFIFFHNLLPYFISESLYKKTK